MDDRVTLDNLSRDLQEARHVRECCISFCKLLQAHKQQQESSWEDFLASKIRFLDMYYLLLDGKALLNLWSDAFKEKADVVMLFFRCYRCLCNFLADEVKMTFTFDEIIARFLQALFIFLEEHDKDEYFILLSNFVQYWDTNLQMHLLPLLVNRNVLANRFVQFADPEWSLSALCLLLKNTTKSTPNIQLCIALANRALTELDATLVTEQSILRFALPKDLSAAILQTIGLNNFPKLLASVLLVLSDRNAISHKSTTLIESLANVAIQTLSQLDRNSLSAALPDLSTSLEVMITLAVSSSLDSSNKLVRICGMKIGKAYANKCGYDLQFDEIPTEEPLDANIDFNTPVLDPSSTSTAAHSDSDSDSDSELEGYGIQDNAIFADLKSIPEIQTNYLSVCLQCK